MLATKISFMNEMANLSERLGADVEMVRQGIGFNSKVLKAVEARNNEQKTTLFRKIDRHFNSDVKHKAFAIWGLSFKPNTNDMRDAPSRVLMEALWGAGAEVQAYDPEGMEEAQRLHGDQDALTLCGTKEAALKGADALTIVTDWQVFKAPGFDYIKQKLKNSIIFDGRNLFDPNRLDKRGMTYYLIGR